MQFAKQNKQEAIKSGYAAGLTGEPDIVNRSYDLFSPGWATDLSVAHDGIQIMLDEDIKAGVVDKNLPWIASSTSGSSNRRKPNYVPTGG